MNSNKILDQRLADLFACIARLCDPLHQRSARRRHPVLLQRKMSGILCKQASAQPLSFPGRPTLRAHLRPQECAHGPQLLDGLVFGIDRLAALPLILLLLVCLSVRGLHATRIFAIAATGRVLAAACPGCLKCARQVVPSTCAGASRPTGKARLRHGFSVGVLFCRLAPAAPSPARNSQGPSEVFYGLCRRAHVPLQCPDARAVGGTHGLQPQPQLVALKAGGSSLVTLHPEDLPVPSGPKEPGGRGRTQAVTGRKWVHHDGAAAL